MSTLKPRETPSGVPSGDPIIVPSSLDVIRYIQIDSGEFAGAGEVRAPLYIRRPLSIPQISLGKQRANRLRDYDCTRYSETELATMSRWDFEGILDNARLLWHRAKAAQIRSDIDLSRRTADVEEIATSNRWGARL